MWGLLISTVLTSAADSLNPFAITQQFVLQGMVKKPKDIWYFIIPTGVTNLIGGFLAYFGLISFIGKILSMFIEEYGQVLFIAEIILGIGFLIGAGLLIQNNKIETLKKHISAVAKEGDKITESIKETSVKIKSVSPRALMALGIGATISELTTALPYFAFLAILFNYKLTFLQLSFILVIYNIIYTMPLIILYFVYIKAQDKFDYLYRVINKKITKWANIAAPLLTCLVGLILTYHGMALLTKGI